MQTIKEAVEKVINLWKDTIDKDVDKKKNTFRLGVDYEHTLYETFKYLDEDPTGLLSCLKLRQAFSEFCNSNSLSVHQLLNGEWDEIKSNMLELKENLHSGVIGNIYNSFVDSILRNIKALGKEMSFDDFNKIEKTEDIFTTAISNFNKSRELNQYKFTEGILKKTKPTIYKKLFRFQSFEQLVDDLKATDMDNFICVALCDRTFNNNDKSDYSESYDSSFNIGLKNNGVVYVISDRTIHRTPTGSYMGRNPGREFWNKVEYSYLPYHKLEEIEELTKDDKDKNLLLTYNEANQSQPLENNNIVNLFDDVGLIYITTLLTLVYNKYFLYIEEDKVELNFFGKNINLLPTSSSKEIVVSNNDLQLSVPSNDITYDTYIETDNYNKIYNNGTFDWLLDIYPLPKQDIKVPTTFIGTKEDAQQNIWWQVRNAQKEHIEKCLKENLSERRDNCCNWLKEQFTKNAESIVNYMLTTQEYNMIDDYGYSHTFSTENQNPDKPFICDLYKNGVDFECSSLLEVGSNTWGAKVRYNFCPYRDNDFSCNSILGRVKCHYTNNYIPHLWLEDDNNNRYYELNLTLRTWADLKKFFKLNELPKDLQRWINLKQRDFKPYTGNSLLDYTDPMNNVSIPYNDIDFNVTLYISKSIYNKIKKLSAK